MSFPPSTQTALPPPAPQRSVSAGVGGCGAHLKSQVAAHPPHQQHLRGAAVRHGALRDLHQHSEYCLLQATGVLSEGLWHGGRARPTGLWRARQCEPYVQNPCVRWASAKPLYMRRPARGESSHLNTSIHGATGATNEQCADRTTSIQPLTTPGRRATSAKRRATLGSNTCSE
jgi:hypothetical protein